MQKNADRLFFSFWTIIKRAGLSGMMARAYINSGLTSYDAIVIINQWRIL
jgi:hypothetical protein